MNTRRALRCAGSSLLVALLAGLGSMPAHAREGLGRVVETLAVDATDADGTWSIHPLVSGQKYEVEVAGTYMYGQGDSLADAECSQLKPDPGWQRNRYLAMTNYEDVLDVYLDNGAVDWVPTERDAFGCNSFNHTYSYSFVMPETRNIRLYVRDIDGSYYENSGTLVVRITEVQADTEGSVPPAPSAPSSAAGAPPAQAPVGRAPAAPIAPKPKSAVASPLASPRVADPPVDDGHTELAMGQVDEVRIPVIAAIPPAPTPWSELLTMIAVGAWASVVTTIVRRYRLVTRSG